MGDKRHGPGSSLTMPVAGRTKRELPDLPGPFHKNKKKVSDTVALPKVSGKQKFYSGMGFTQIIVTNELLFEIEMQSYMYTRFTHRQTNTHT